MSLKSAPILLLWFVLITCDGNSQLPYPKNLNLVPSGNLKVVTDNDILTGAEQVASLTEVLQFKKVGLIANHTSLVDTNHLVDSMLAAGIEVTKLFSPEHGFRGKYDAGELVSTKKDKKTGLPIVSLYGKNKKPKVSDLLEIDAMVFDLQDVGVRFYTYISTLYYAMEACAESGIPIYVLDRPNPNGFYVDGPMLKEGFESFVGVVKIPVVYGLTIGEFAAMVNEEGMLYDDLKCDLTVVPLKGYQHNYLYQLPVKPSPNLPNMTSVYLYPNLCFFEGTVVSVGRGTNLPFQIFGHPRMSGDYTFTPEPTEGASAPKLEGQFCRGKSLEKFDIKKSFPSYFTLQYLMEVYKDLDLGEAFFLENKFIDLLYGSDELRNQLLEGKSASEIRASWEPELSEYRATRKNYLMYPEF